MSLALHVHRYIEKAVHDPESYSSLLGHVRTTAFSQLSLSNYKVVEV